MRGKDYDLRVGSKETFDLKKVKKFSFPEKKEKLVNHVKTDSSVFDGEQSSKVKRFL
jgi:hypothetical protein